jgi:hypothetical protein
MKGEGVSPIRVADQPRSPDTLLKLLPAGPGQHLSLGSRPHRPDQRIVNVEYRPPISRKRLNQLTLGLRNRCLTAELADVGLSDVQHYSDPGWRDVAEIRDMTNAARAHLQNHEARSRIDVAHGQRNPDLVVEIARRCHSGTGLFQHLCQQILG